MATPTPRRDAPEAHVTDDAPHHVDDDIHASSEVQPAPNVPASPALVTDELERLTELNRTGVITDEELEARRIELLA